MDIPFLIKDRKEAANVNPIRKRMETGALAIFVLSLSEIVLLLCTYWISTISKISTIPVDIWKGIG